MKKIDLIQDTIDNQDIDNLIEWLKTYPRLTKGSKTIEFESKWAKWLGTKYSVFVNSGSSVITANQAASGNYSSGSVFTTCSNRTHVVC